LFVNPTLYDFNLKPGSPCLGAGTGGSDLGAGYHPAYAGQSQLMLSEIYYNDTQNGDAEFLEILNPGSAPRSLGGYTLTDAVEFKFPPQASIGPGERIVIARKASIYIGNGYQVFQWTKGHLANEGERIVLNDENGILADFVRYTSVAPWPDTLATYGKSLELVSENLDNHFQTSWQLSPNGGSPGNPALATGEPAVSILQLTLFPNPATAVINLALKSTEPGDFIVNLYDFQGKLEWSDHLFVSGGLTSRPCYLGNLAAGQYLITVTDKQGRVLGKEAFIKQ
jgi:hypothetical protein